MLKLGISAKKLADVLYVLFDKKSLPRISLPLLQTAKTQNVSNFTI